MVSNLVRANTLRGDLKCVSFAPPKLNSIIEQADRDSVATAVASSGILYAVHNKQLNSRTVANLLRMGRPTAVFGRVVSVIVNPVNRVSRRRFFAHILKEAGKARYWFVPAPTNLNTPPAVTVKSLVPRVVTTLSHSSPRIVLRTVDSVTTMSISAVRSFAVALNTALARVIIPSAPKTLKYIAAFALNNITVSVSRVVGNDGLNNSQSTPFNVGHEYSISQGAVHGY